jgi:hypothetical protein
MVFPTRLGGVVLANALAVCCLSCQGDLLLIPLVGTLNSELLLGSRLSLLASCRCKKTIPYEEIKLALNWKQIDHMESRAPAPGKSVSWVSDLGSRG